jgi:hypothetical protein
MAQRLKTWGGLVAGLAVLLGMLGLPGFGSPPAPAGPAALGQEPVASPATAAAAPPELPRPAQPAADLLRISRGGAAATYQVWDDLAPLLVTTPDGGAWAFFSAYAKGPEGPDPLRLYAARFDPTAAVWLPAEPLAGGAVQFGPAAAVAPDGTVHLVYSDRASADRATPASLVYTRFAPGGAWAPSTPIAPHPDAGYQMIPAVALDDAGRPTVLWRDQRNVLPELRALDPANADLFASQLGDAGWSAPVQISRRPAPDVSASFPHLARDGDRFVAVWSVYRGTAGADMRRAVRVEWSSRPLADPAAWARPEILLDGADGEVGGRSLDLAADPRGGVALVYSRLIRETVPPTNGLALRRLDPAAVAWGVDLPLASGDLGYFPELAVGGDGAAVVVFNVGRNRVVEVGALGSPAGAPAAPPPPAVLLTAADEGAHGQPTVALGPLGDPWVLYLHEPVDGRVSEVRALRGARLRP